MTNPVTRDVFSKERKELYKRYITFFRLNPHIFIKRYFGIRLYPYQVLMIWVLQRSTLGYIVASRAGAKSWIIALWALTRAVLYPQSKVVICAKTLKQGSLILSEKLTSMIDNYPNVAREVESITTNANVSLAVFKNGSTIKVVPSSENARGNRANYIIVEESRLVPKEVLEAVIKPFLESRQAPFRLKPEYREDDRYREEGVISYITSAWYKSEYWYQYVRNTIRRMMSGDEGANFLAFDYLITLRHNIKTKQMLKDEMEDSDSLTVQMEYENIPSGQSGKSYYTMGMFNRSMKRAFYPQRLDTYKENKNPYGIKKVDGEIRIISVDIATRSNKQSDNTIISCARLIPIKGKGYARHLVYMESHKGSNTVKQAERIKEIYYDFEGDWVVLDLQNAGISVFDSLTQVTHSDERGLDFPAFTVADSTEIPDKLKEELRDRTLGVNALPVVFPILGTSQLNAVIAVAFRTALQKKMWNFLLPDNDVEEFLIKNYKDINDSANRAFYINPFFQTTLLIGECLNLDMTLKNGIIKLEEKVGSYKDRFSSVSYLNHVATFFDKELLKESDNTSDEDAILAVSSIL